MIDEQNLAGTGFNSDHIVYSSFFSDNHIVQQTAIVHPKTLLIDGLRKIFRNGLKCSRLQKILYKF